MFDKPENRKFIKNCLFAVNISLVLIFVVLFLYGIFIVRPQRISQATSIDQYLFFDLNKLPQGLDTLEPDYIGPTNIKNIKVKEDRSALDKQNMSQDYRTLSVSMPKVAILITNIGLNKRINDIALELPAEISLGLLPYSSYKTSFLEDAANKGHEVFLYLPLYEGNNSRGFKDTFLIPTIDNKENISRLDAILNISGKFSGLYSNSKEIFTNDVEAFKPIINKIASQNLIFVLGKVNHLSLDRQLLKKKNIIRTNIIIDHVVDETMIRKNLEQLIENAKNNGMALGYASSYILTMKIIKEWLSTIRTSGVELVPVSHLIQERNL